MSSTKNISVSQEIDFKIFDKYLKEFNQAADERFANLDFNIDQRYKFFKSFFTKDSIDNWTWEKLQSLGDNLHTFQTMALAKKKALGDPNQDISKYKSQFKALLYDFDNFEDILNKATNPNSEDWIPYFGRSTLSEILSYVHDDKYVIFNSRTKLAMQVLGIKAPTFRKFGTNFIAFNNLIEPYLKRFSESHKMRSNTSMNLEFDQFMSWISDTYGKEYVKNETINLIIENYKDHLRNDGLDDEIYKWRLLKKYRGWPDFESESFKDQIKNTNFSNLVYFNSKSVLMELAEKEESLTKKYLNDLLNGTEELSDRVSNFISNFKSLFKNYNKDHSSHQDERAAATYLTYHDPDNYTFYKSTTYKEVCKLLGSKKPKKLSNYEHYLQIVQEIKTNYIEQDSELLELVESKLDSESYSDPEQLLLVQDMLYQTVSKINRKINHWVFQGNPNIFDFDSALKKNELNTYFVSSHKNSIESGDKVINWVTGEKAGCYALLEVTSDPELIPDEDLDHYINKTNNTDELELRCRVKVTHNFVNNPILKEQIIDLPEFKNFNGGNQGTNFKSNKDEYEKMLVIGKGQNKEDKKYWLYAPGEGASKWDEFYENGIMGLGWDELGDLNNLGDRNNIEKVIKDTYGNKNPYNTVLANFEFRDVISIGDIIIPKRGKSDYLGYGIVESDYYYDSSKDTFQKTRKVKWIKNGVWEENGGPIVTKTLTDITKYPEYVDKLIKLIGIETEAKQNVKSFNNLDFSLNTILYGPPGTGKTYNTVNHALEILGHQTYGLERDSLVKEFHKYVNDKRIVFTTFHQSMSYEDFIEGIKPVIGIEEEIGYEIKDGIFKSICKSADLNPRESSSYDNFEEKWDDLIDLVKSNIAKGKLVKIGSWDYGLSSKESLKYSSNNTPSKYNFTITKQNVYDAFQGKKARPSGAFQKDMEDIVDFMKSNVNLNEFAENSTNPVSTNNNYVLIIDEINRGNVSSIFGELITLIETDKRTGMKNEITVTLPYSKEQFSVPPNLYIIGTMNTADRSVEALDTALRRRFSFIEMMPDPKKLSEEEFKLKDIDLEKLLSAINGRIERLLDKDYCIGHSYFMSIKDKNKPLKELKDIFKNKILPLMQEYFYGDWGKIQLVLGKGFVEKKSNNISFLESDSDTDEFEDRHIYNFTNSDAWTLDSFKSIYE